MTDVERCLAQIDAVRDAASDPEMAYLLRTRLRRALLTCARTAADLAGADRPELPRDIGKDSYVGVQPVELSMLAAQILSASSHLCQPSEALDVRWESGWRELDAMLERLREALEDLGRRRT